MTPSSPRDIKLRTGSVKKSRAARWAPETPCGYCLKILTVENPAEVISALNLTCRQGKFAEGIAAHVVNPEHQTKRTGKPLITEVAVHGESRK